MHSGPPDSSAAKSRARPPKQVGRSARRGATPPASAPSVMSRSSGCAPTSAMPRRSPRPCKGARCCFTPRRPIPKLSPHRCGRGRCARGDGARARRRARGQRAARGVHQHVDHDCAQTEDRGRWTTGDRADYYRPGSARSAYYEAKFAMEQMALAAAPLDGVVADGGVRPGRRQADHRHRHPRGGTRPHPGLLRWHHQCCRCPRRRAIAHRRGAARPPWGAL